MLGPVESYLAWSVGVSCFDYQSRFKSGCAFGNSSLVGFYLKFEVNNYTDVTGIEKRTEAEIDNSLKVNREHP